MKLERPQPQALRSLMEPLRISQKGILAQTRFDLKRATWKPK